MFSIITASFNQGRFIRECIESVVSQGVEFEHIIVDACSTDETRDVLREFPHLKWTSEPDKGQTDAINKGFRRARGEWLMWLNADDFLLPNALKKVTDHIRQTEADVVYGNANFVGMDGRLIREKREPDFHLGELLFYGCYIPSTATFHHRRIIDAGHLLDASLKVCMDLEWFLRLAGLRYRFSHIDAPLAAFRWHETNVSRVHADKRITEGNRVKREFLKKQGREWLGNRAMLWLMHKVYRLRRVIRLAATSSRGG